MTKEQADRRVSRRAIKEAAIETHEEHEKPVCNRYRISTNYASYAKGVDKTFRLVMLRLAAGQSMTTDVRYVMIAMLPAWSFPMTAGAFRISVRSWNLDLEDGDRRPVTSDRVVCTRATTAQLMDDNGMDVNAKIIRRRMRKPRVVAVVCGEMYDDTVLTDEEDLAEQRCTAPADVTLPTIQNTTFVFGINRSYDNYNYDK